MKEDQTKIVNFEEALSSLEGIVSELESGRLPLEKSIERFEEGVKLYKNCKSILGKVEKRIKVLTENLKEEDFQDENINEE